MTRPQGMIEATEYANKTGVSVEDVIAKITDSTYVGREVDGEWYLETPRGAIPVDNTNSQNKNTKLNESRDEKVPTSYGTARVLLKISIFLGWIIVLAGAVWLLNGFASSYGAEDKLIKGGVGLLIGFAIIQANQVVLAIVDTADNTRALLNVMRNK